MLQPQPGVGSSESITSSIAKQRYVSCVLRGVTKCVITPEFFNCFEFVAKFVLGDVTGTNLLSPEKEVAGR
jgi:hypothetical protein